MKKQPALSAAHCQVLQQPFYQFAQMKQFAPDSIEGVKAQYRAAWTDWRDFVLAVQAALGGWFEQHGDFALYLENGYALDIHEAEYEWEVLETPAD